MSQSLQSRAASLVVVLYHVLTTPELYFGAGGNFTDIFKIWKGGLGIWGAIGLGALGAYIAYRRIARRIDLPSFAHFADTVAPGLLLAQAIGRVGNWFNAELFGRPLDTWWALEIPENFRPAGYEAFATFHPTFAYEAIATASLAVLLIALGTRYPAGSIFALYVAGYCLARFFIEGIRIDQAHSLGWASSQSVRCAHTFLSGMRCLHQIETLGQVGLQDGPRRCLSTQSQPPHTSRWLVARCSSWRQ